MELYFDKDELLEHLKSFYILTHIRITVFDSSFQEIISYPKEKCPLCAYFRKNPSFDKECRLCDAVHMEEAKTKKETYIYQCHNGIYEIISPLFLGDKVIGYLFFSHILNYKTHEEAYASILQHLGKYQNQYDFSAIKDYVNQMPLFNDEYLLAASKLLEETASYLTYTRIAYLKSDELSAKINDYIENNLGDNLSIPNLCKTFGLGKTALYQRMNQYYGEPLAEHIRKLRIQKACDKILEGKNVNFSDIASEVGFDNYSYFIVAFKKEKGMTPKEYQKAKQEQKR